MKPNVQYKLLVLADGPCASESFRPNEDATQWWARRDALVRIIFSHQQGRIPVRDDSEPNSFIMFHNGNPSSEDKSVSIMSITVDGAAVISEMEVISAMRRSGRGPKMPTTFTARSRTTCELVSESIQEVGRNDHNGGIEGMNKKELLTFIQKSCSMEFLRQHHLNSSIEIILRKKNLQQLRDTWDAWKSINASVSSSTSPEDDEKLRLTTSFASFFRRYISSSDVSSSLTILLLHEDYKNELPVFSHDISESNLTSNRTVLCVMGAVRDMTQLETTCLWEAAQQVGAEIVTANLGRTAEFTSKIVMALRSHALHNHRLFFATQQLLWRQRGVPNELLLMEKDLSIRANQSTWDGYQTSHHKKKQDDSTSVIHVPPHILEPIYPQIIILAASLPYTVAEVTVDLNQRDMLLPCLRLMVFSLWKSRLVSDLSTAKEGESAINENRMLANILYLSFSCGTTLRIDQSCIAREVALNHYSAPSEFHLVSMLHRIISEVGLSSRTPLIQAVYEGINDSFEASAHRPTVMTGILEASGLPSEHVTLSDFAYSAPCWCCSDNYCKSDSSKFDIPRVLVVFDELSVLNVSANCPQSFEESIYSVLPTIGMSRKLRKQISRGYIGRIQLFQNQGSSKEFGIPFQICTLQHWAYHGRLFPALKEYKEQRDKCSSLDDGEISKKKKKSRKHKSGDRSESKDDDSIQSPFKKRKKD